MESRAAEHWQDLDSSQGQAIIRRASLQVIDGGEE
jgi:hypothetical protein